MANQRVAQWPFLIVIGDGTGDSPEGHIENVISLDGLFLDSNGIYGTVFENTFENSDPVTHVLVEDSLASNSPTRTRPSISTPTTTASSI